MNDANKQFHKGRSLPGGWGEPNKQSHKERHFRGPPNKPQNALSALNMANLHQLRLFNTLLSINLYHIS